MRQGSSLHVGAAWRVFPQVIDFADIEKPSDLLRRFVDVYGLEVERPGGITGRLLQNVVIPVPSDEIGQSRFAKVHDPRDEDYLGVFSGSSVKVIEDDLIVSDESILIAGYAIRLGRYRSDRLKFG